MILLGTSGKAVSVVTTVPLYTFSLHFISFFSFKSVITKRFSPSPATFDNIAFFGRVFNPALRSRCASSHLEIFNSLKTRKKNEKKMLYVHTEKLISLHRNYFYTACIKNSRHGEIGKEILINCTS